MKLNLLILSLLGLFLIACSSKQEKNMDDKAYIFYTSGTQNLMAKKYTEALMDLKEAEKLDPKNTEIHNNLAMAYFFKNDMDMAKKHWIRALEVDGNNLDARNNLASLYFTQKNFIEARKNYEIVLADLTYPNQFRTYHNLGLIELESKNRERAKDYFAKAVEENENYCPAYFQLGLLSYQAGEYNQAYDHFKNSVIGDCVASNSEAIYYQGLCSMKMGNTERAKLKFLDLLKRFPTSPSASKAQMQIDRIQQIDSNSVVKSAVQEGQPKEEQIQSFLTP